MRAKKRPDAGDAGLQGNDALGSRIIPTEIAEPAQAAHCVILLVEECSDRRGGYVARVEGSADILCTTREPFFHSARVLLADGFDPDLPLIMRHRGSPIDALKSTIGKAAKLTVREGEGAGPRIVRWRPHPGCAVASPARELGEGLPNIGAASNAPSSGGGAP